MKKRILSTFLTMAMLISAIPSAMAAKNTDAAGVNIYADIGSFETEAQKDKMVFVGAGGKIVKGGKGGNCLKVEVVTDDYGAVRFPFPGVAGETYQISFWVRTDDAPANISLNMYYTGASYSGVGNAGNADKDWSLCSVTWTCTGIDHSGKQTSGAGNIEIRYGDGRTPANYYIDDLKVVPVGDVEGADYSSLKLDQDASSSASEKDVYAPVEVAPVAFSDMENHWAKDTVNTLATYGFINGMGNNTYSPNTNVTRAQFTKMMTDMVEYQESGYDATYSDIKGNEWFAAPISMATKMGIIDPTMVFGNHFKPDQAITREEAASIAARMAEYKNATEKGAAPSFVDESEISEWARGDVKDAAAYGLIQGYENGTYKPKANITRAEAATILKRVAEFSTLFGIYVDSETGDDSNEGTKDAPLKTIFEARDRVRKVNKTMTNDIHVYIRGEHYLEKPFELGAEDSGMNNHRIIYTSWGEEKPTLTMGKKFTGFTLHDAEKNIYKIHVGNTNSRQAYFNDVRGIRARSVAGFKDPVYFLDSDIATFHTKNPEFLNYKYPTEIEGVWHSNWRMARLMLENIRKLDEETVEIKLSNKIGSMTAIDGVTSWMSEGNPKTYPAYLENAYEFLDQPSEWYLDTHEGYLYYIPREGEDMTDMVVTLPVGETLVQVASRDPENPVRNLTFDNIEFAETSWMRPSENGGLNMSQNLSLGGAEELVKHAVLFLHARHINFTNNKLTRLGGAGLVVSGGIQHFNVMGNEFFDISAGGVTFGVPNPFYSSDGLIYRDNQLPEKQSLWNAWNQIHNNFFYGCAVEYEPAVPLSMSFPRHSSVRYNYFGTTPYSAIHGGWHWGGLHISGSNNYDFDISHNYFTETLNGRLYDGACIYWLGSNNNDALVEEEDYSRIYRNYFENPRNGYGAFYPDDGSRGWMVEENVTDLSDVKNWKFNYDTGVYDSTQVHWLMVWIDTVRYITTKNNYVTTPTIRDTSKHHTNNLQESFVYPDANWPAEAQAIIDEAYIQPEYLDNFDKKDGPLSFVAREREYMVGLDEAVPLDFKIYGNYQKEYDLKDFDIDYWVSDPSLLSVDENGVMTAHGKGTVWVVANVNVGGFIQTKSVKVLAGEKIEKLDTNLQIINMVPDYTAAIQVNAITTYGNTQNVNVANVTFTSADESIASVDSFGQVKGLKEGSTTIKVVANAHNLTLEKDVVVNIVALSNPAALELPYEKVDSSFFLEPSWAGSASASGNGVTVKGSPTYLNTPMEGKLYAFDLTIKPETSWPSLTIGASDRMGTFANDNTYLIGFKSNHIEVQRFNKGVRTMLFGEENYHPIGGPGIPNPSDAPIYEYNKPFSVIVGALEHPDGTRLVLTINGVNILDYVDASKDAVKPGGLFGVYDQFTFAPYSGRKAK